MEPCWSSGWACIGNRRLSPQGSQGVAVPARRENPGVKFAHCHRSAVTPAGSLPFFTDFGLMVIGVPRNTTMPANADPTPHDLGLRGPDRRDYLDQPRLLRLVHDPTLRNVAPRQSFFHDGVRHSLRDVASGNGIRCPAMAASGRSTTCRRSTMTASTRSRRSTGMWATHPPFPSRRSTTSAVSCRPRPMAANRRPWPARLPRPEITVT